MLIPFGLSIIFSILMCVHAVRSGREMYWLFIILVFQPIGGLVYLITQFLPEAMTGTTARRLGEAAQQTLDPHRAYREAKAALEDSPTVGNKLRLGQAAASMGNHEEAEQLFREAAVGVHEDDPALLMGRAQALVELERYEEALDVLKTLGDIGDKGRTPQAALAMARCHHALGNLSEAATAYEWAAERTAGLEASARYAVFLKDTGQEEDAAEIVADLKKRVEKTAQPFRKEARYWRDFAAEHVHGG